MGGGGGGYAARLFILFSFPCSADHERDWPPCIVVFSGWQPIRLFVVLGLRCLLGCHVLKGFGIYMIGILDRLY